VGLVGIGGNCAIFDHRVKLVVAVYCVFWYLRDCIKIDQLCIFIMVIKLIPKSD
jgi:hypothetical protein